jgi:molybdate transport system ATP-binding protein
VDAAGERVRVEVDAVPPVVAEITPAALAELRLATGDEVWVAVKATDVRLEPA